MKYTYKNNTYPLLKPMNTIEFSDIKDMYDDVVALYFTVNQIIPTGALELYLGITTEDVCNLYICACDLNKKRDCFDKRKRNICKAIEFLVACLLNIESTKEDELSIRRCFIPEYCKTGKEAIQVSGFYESLFGEKLSVNSKIAAPTSYNYKNKNHLFATAIKKIEAYIETETYKSAKGILWHATFQEVGILWNRKFQEVDNNDTFKIPQVPRKRKADDLDQSTSIHPNKVSKVAGEERRVSTYKINSPPCNNMHYR